MPGFPMARRVASLGRLRTIGLVEYPGPGMVPGVGVAVPGLARFDVVVPNDHHLAVVVVAESDRAVAAAVDEAFQGLFEASEELVVRPLVFQHWPADMERLLAVRPVERRAVFHNVHDEAAAERSMPIVNANLETAESLAKPIQHQLRVVCCSRGVVHFYRLRSIALIASSSARISTRSRFGMFTTCPRKVSSSASYRIPAF